MKPVRIYGRLGLLPLAATIFLFLTVPSSVRADATADLADAYQLFRSGKLTDALAKYQAVLATDSSIEQQSQALFWTGIVQESSVQNDAAISSFEALAALAPNYRWPEVTHKLAVRYRAKDDTAKAQYFFDLLRRRSAQETDPKTKSRADLLIGDYLKQGGEWGKAFQHFQSIRNLYPEHAEDILFQVAYTAHSAGQYDSAIKAGQEYTKTYPDNGRFDEAAFRLVEDLRYANRHQEALAYLDTLCVARPDLMPRIKVTRAEVLAEGLKLVHESNTLAQQIIAENQDPYQVYLAKYRLAFNYLNKLHDVPQARALLTEIVDQYPKDNMAVEIASDIASTYGAEGNYRQAVKLYKDALAKYPCPVPEWDAWIRYMIGHSHLQAEDYPQVREAWLDLIDKHPSNEWAKVAQDEMKGLPQ